MLDHIIDHLRLSTDHNELMQARVAALGLSFVVASPLVKQIMALSKSEKTRLLDIIMKQLSIVGHAHNRAMAKAKQGGIVDPMQVVDAVESAVLEAYFNQE